MQTVKLLNLDGFFPKDCFEIKKAERKNAGVHIYLKSITHSCRCPKCGMETTQFHGTYVRTIQDLPILGRKTTLFINAHEYICPNDLCPTKTIAERYNGFLGYYGRYTERCEDLIETLALETSCEGAARVCKELGIQISGDTIIRILKNGLINCRLNLRRNVLALMIFLLRRVINIVQLSVMGILIPLLQF